MSYMKDYKMDVEREAMHIDSFIDASFMKHNVIAAAIDMPYYSFSDRYKARVRWKRDELMKLASVIGCTYEELVDC